MMSAVSSSPIESRTTSGPAPACTFCASESWRWVVEAGWMMSERVSPMLDRKSTRLNSSHVSISYAVFCLKKKNQQLYSDPPKDEFDVRDTALRRGDVHGSYIDVD